MASLTTVYFLSLILASFAGMGSGWYGSTFNNAVEEPPVEEPPTGPEIAPPESSTEQTEPPVSEEVSQYPSA